MILVTRINKVEQFYVNEDKIEFIEETPDTIISLESGKKIVVMETAQQVIHLIMETRAKQAAFQLALHTEK
jgi:flagellar protein FlbD